MAEDPRSEKLPAGSTETPKTIRASIQYNTFQDALTYSWAGLRKNLTRNAQPGIVFTIFGAFVLVAHTVS